VARTIAGEGREEFGPFSEKYIDSLNTTDESDGSILTEMLRPALLLVDVVLIIAGMRRIALKSCESFVYDFAKQFSAIKRSHSAKYPM
jgi:hypothetical protein